MPFERFYVQCLRDNVCVVFFGVHMLYIYYPPLDYVPNDAMLDVHVPRPLASESILHHVYRFLVDPDVRVDREGH